MVHDRRPRRFTRGPILIAIRSAGRWRSRGLGTVAALSCPRSGGDTAERGSIVQATGIESGQAQTALRRIGSIAVRRIEERMAPAGLAPPQFRIGLVEPLYEVLSREAVLSAEVDQVASFPGKKRTPPVTPELEGART